MDMYSPNFKYSPLMYDRNRSWLNGAMLHYMVGATQDFTTHFRNYSYNFNLGLEVLGGDLQTNILGGYDERTNTNQSSKFLKWRYFFGDNPYLTQITLGNSPGISNTGPHIIQTTYNGIQVSNDIVTKSTYFTNIIIDDKIDPDWEVELWINKRLYEHKKPDLLGYYRFEIPIQYGNNDVEVRYYGPKGEFITKKDIISIPGSLLKPGEIRYLVGYGIDPRSGSNIYSSRLGTGFTSWLTNSISVEKDVINNKPKIQEHLYARLYETTNMDFDFDPTNSFKASLLSTNYTGISYTLAYTKFLPNEYGTMPALNSIDATLGYNQLFSLPLSTTMQLQRQQLDDSRAYTMTTNIYANISRYSIIENYRATVNEQNKRFENFYHTLGTELSVRTDRMPPLLFLFDNSRLRITSDYEISTGRINDINFNMDKMMFGIAQLTLGTGYNFFIKQPFFNLNLVINFSKLRTSSYSNYNPSYGNATQTLEGILGFDSYQRKILFTNPGNQSANSTGATTMRFFIDENGDGVYNKDEFVIPGVNYSISYGVQFDDDKASIKHILDLPAYGRYNIKVNQESFKNPLWMPKTTEFSFIADPNSFKPIDVPCYTAGIIEGSVLKVYGKHKIAQSGIKIHVLSEDKSWSTEIPVYSDGNFYYMGIPPGNYTAYVDSIQLDILNLYSSPESITFTIKKNLSGDEYSNLNFELTSKIGTTTAGNKNPDKQDVAAVPEGNTQKKEITVEGTRPETKDSTITLKKNDKNSIKQKFTDLFGKDTVSKEMPKNEYNIVFPKQVTFLSVTIQRQLDKVAEYLNANPKTKLNIKSYNDDALPKEENQRILDKRSNEIRTYLTVRKGISKSRIKALDNIADTSKKKNNTVELQVSD
jgi:outer membrane protein OmpA-like peptidoglycan-associated protein